MNAQLVTHRVKYPASANVTHLSPNPDEHARMILTVNSNGMIAECNRAGAKLLGCLPSELIWQPVSKLLPKLQNIDLLQGQNVNPYLNFLSRAGYLFELHSQQGIQLVCRVFFCVVGSVGRRCLRVIICPERAAASGH